MERERERQLCVSFQFVFLNIPPSYAASGLTDSQTRNRDRDGAPALLHFHHLYPSSAVTRPHERERERNTGCTTFTSKRIALLRGAEILHKPGYEINNNKKFE